MERLQAAIEKARKAREAAQSDATGAPANAHGVADPDKTVANGTMPATDMPTTDRPAAQPVPAAGITTTMRPFPLDPQAMALSDAWMALEPMDTRDRKLEANRIVTRVAGAKAAPFDILRTKVLVQMRQNGWKRLAITSPYPDSGKTTTACNLALGLGRQNDMRSMLMDLDLRSPSVANFFGVEPKRSIGDMLVGNVPFGAQAMRFGSNVAVSMANRAENDPARILLAEETAEVISEVEAAYQPDLTIFDLPSVLVNDDTRAFLKNVDCALIVVRANKTRYSQFDRCEREIAEQTNVLGTVLNAYRHGRSGDSDG